MWKTFFTALLCLLALSTEIVLDPSTNFVRSTSVAPSEAGLYAAGYSGYTSPSPSEGDASHSNAPDLSDLFHAAAPSHAACITSGIIFPSYTLSTALTLLAAPTYSAPSLRLEHRPPIAA